MEILSRIKKVMAMMSSQNIAVVGIEELVYVSLNDFQVNPLTDFFCGKIRVQTSEAKYQDVDDAQVEVPRELELRAQMSTDATKFEITLKYSLGENVSKNDDVVFFNNIEKLSDCNVYFEGLKFTLAPLAVREITYEL